MKDELELQLGGATRRTRHIDTQKAARGRCSAWSEFTLYVDDVNGSRRMSSARRESYPKRMIPRTGRSYQLPAGGAIYFDTGVIEVATPIIELAPGCCYRATRLLWEQIRYVRKELDAWGKKHGHKCRLQGFSTHYNFSFPAARRTAKRTSSNLAFLLTHILPAPVALLAGKSREQRRRRAATWFTAGSHGGFHTGCRAHARDVRLCRRRGRRRAALGGLRTRQIEAHGIPRLQPLRIRKHSSRRGWRIVPSSLQQNPFTCDTTAEIWKLRDGRTVSLRQAAAETMRPFRAEIRRLSDAATLEHIEAVFAGNARSLLDFPERPAEYDDAGHALDWNRRRMRHWRRSQYERVIHRVIAREPIRINGKRYTVQRMQGWYEIVFREAKTGTRRVLNLDELVRLTRTKR
jgi:hypothetical protein